jgi:ankyrin repeat protein
MRISYWLFSVGLASAMFAVGCGPKAPPNPYHDAAKYGVTQLEEAKKTGADINGQDSDKRTALHYAAKSNNVESVKFLIANGAKLNIQDEDQETPLFIACDEGFDEVTKVLLEAGADPNILNEDHEAPLSIASSDGHGACVRLLLATKKVDMNNQDEGGGTALYYAAKRGHADIVQMLLDAGADTKIRNKDDETAEMIAAKQAHPEIVKMIRERSGGAMPTTQPGNPQRPM